MNNYTGTNSKKLLINELVSDNAQLNELVHY